MKSIVANNLVRLKGKRSIRCFAQVIGVQPSTVGYWFAKGGIPRACHLQKISQAFGVSVDWLLQNENEIHNQ